MRGNIDNVFVVMLVPRTIASAMLGVLPLIAWAQEPSAEAYVEIDLDGRGAPERVYAAAGDGPPGFLVAIWNGGRGEWIDVFRGAGGVEDVSVVEPQEGGLATLRHAGRDWLWVRTRYVPLIRAARIEPEPLDPALRPAVAEIAGVSATTAIEAYPYPEADGTTSLLAVPQPSTATCAMAGALCPAITVSGGEVLTDVGVHIGFWWAPSDRIGEDGRFLIEKGRAEGVMLVSPASGEVVGQIGPVRPRVSPIQPSEPET